MTQVNLSMSISADGFVAGPNQSEDNPLGEGGLALHAWHIGDQAERTQGRRRLETEVPARALEELGTEVRPSLDRPSIGRALASQSSVAADTAGQREDDRENRHSAAELLRAG